MNELVGDISIIPIVPPYKIAWIEHREHHAHANDPELDPDFGFNGRNVWHAIWNGMQSRQPGPAYWAMRDLLAKRGVRDDRPDAIQTAATAQ